MDEEVWALFHRFERRMRKLGINITYISNMPWIYMRQVNGKPVKKTFQGEHGFTIFWYPIKAGDKVEFTNRRLVFQLIREML